MEAAAASRPLTAVEEATKRNTDCVYFLASPLTCKKGNECEYRHSESARVNPRDCWYWLNGNCSNPKCQFRHPPLDALFGTSGIPSGPAPHSSQVFASTQIPMAQAPGGYNAGKPNVPCYYFQMGQCLKGDRCAFMHGPHPASNHVPQPVAKVSPSFTQAPQTLSWGLKECTAQQNFPKPTTENPVEVPHSSVKSVNKAESAPNSGLPLKKKFSPYPPEYDLPGSQPAVAPVSSDSAPSRSRSRQPQPVEEYHPNGREADDFLGESSPGFDVLVDDDIGESEYYHSKEDFGASVHGGRNPNMPVNDFEYHRPDYEPVADFEGDLRNGTGEHGRYGRPLYSRDRQRTSSEKVTDRLSMPERRVRHREASPDEINGSDLRHRLLKQRRHNGLRSAVSPDRRGEVYRRDRHSVEDRYHRRPSGRDQRHLSRDSSISTRLQGRIKLPDSSSADHSIELRSERDRDRDGGRHRGRLSPVRPISHQGRPHDGIKRRLNGGFTEDGRSLGGQPNRKDDADPLNFAGPKSLAELKGAKVSGSSEEPPTKSMNSPLAVGHQASEESLSFDGPKPLSAILKRKRETTSRDGSVSSSGDENNQREVAYFIGSASVTAASSGMPSHVSLKSVQDGKQTGDISEEPKVTTVEDEEEEGLLLSEGGELLQNGQSSAKDDMHELEDDAIADEIDDKEVEHFDVIDGESDYNATEGGEFKSEDAAENAYQDDDYEELDDEDDDFAKKVGGLFS